MSRILATTYYSPRGRVTATISAVVDSDDERVSLPRILEVRVNDKDLLLKAADVEPWTPETPPNTSPLSTVA